MRDLIIATTPRTGGNWLMSLLHEAGLPMGGEWATDGVLWDKVQESRIDNVPFVLELHTGEVWLDPAAMPGTDWSREIVWVHLIRNSIEDQAESWAGAKKSGSWFDGSTRGIAPARSEDLNAILEMNLWWESVLPEHIHVSYESLLVDGKGIAKTIKEMVV